MKFRSFAMIAATLTTAAVLFSACSDTTTTPNNTAKNYMPLTIGSSWQYEGVSLDTAGKEQGAPIPVTRTAERTADTLGKTKVTIVNSTLAGIEAVIQEGTFLMVHDSPFNFGLANVTVSARWIKQADFSATATEWAIFDTTIANVATQIDVGGQNLPVTINGTASVKGARVGTETITVKGKSYANCLKIKQTTTSQFKIKASLVSGFPEIEIPVTGTVTLTAWYCDGVGLVKLEGTALVPRADLSAVPAAFKSAVQDGLNGLIEPGARLELTASVVK